MATKLEALTIAELTTYPNGTTVKTWGSYRAETSGTAYRLCNYLSPASPAAHTPRACGDRLTLSRATARIDKTTLPADSANFIEAGSQVQFSLAPTYTSVGGSISDTIIIVDTLPIGAEYVAGSALQNGTALAPIVTGNLSIGQTLTWNLGVLTVNTAIAPITFAMSTPSYTADGTTLANVARIDTDTDVSSAAQRSDTRSVIVTSPPSMIMGKSVTVGGVDPDTAIEFSINYDNETSSSLTVIDVIDILPYNGDGRFPSSSFSGGVGLDSVTTQSNNALFYISKDAPTSLDPDPQDSTNTLATGSAHWCPLTAAHGFNAAAVPSSGGGSGLCPASFAAVTAVRIVDQQALAPAASRSFTVELDLSGNVGGDIYTNQAQGTADGVLFSPQTPFASTTIMGYGLLQGSKTVEVWDPDGTGLYAVPGNEVIYTIFVQNTGDGPVDSGSILIIDSFPDELEFWNGDIDAGGPDNFPGTAPVGFEQLVGTGVSFNPATDIAYSTSTTKPANYAACTSIAADGTFRPDINFICVNPKGVLDDGTPDPKIGISIRARIK